MSTSDPAAPGEPPAGYPGASQPPAEPAAPEAPSAPPPYTGAPAPTPAPAYGAPPAYPNQPAYGSAPAYPSAPPANYAYGGYPAQPKTNGLAIASLILSIAGLVVIPFIGSLVGAILGHVSLGQLKTSGEQGRGLALSGVIVGWAGLALSVLFGIIAIAWFSWFFATIPDYRSV